MAVLDISRFLEQPHKHYSGARLQQGRLVLDADFNEGSEAGEDDQRQAVLDLVGPMGSPDDGFSLGAALPPTGDPPPDTAPLKPGSDLFVESIKLNGEMTSVHGVSIRPGSYYIGGRRFVNEQPEHIAMQRDWLQMRPSDVPSMATLGASRLRPEIHDGADTDGGDLFPSGVVELTVAIDGGPSPAIVVFVASRAEESATNAEVGVIFQPSTAEETTFQKLAAHVISTEIEDAGTTTTVFTELSVHVLLAGDLTATGSNLKVHIVPPGVTTQVSGQAYVLHNVDPDTSLLPTLITDRGLGSQIEGFFPNPNQLLLSAVGAIRGSGLAPADDSEQDNSDVVPNVVSDLAFGASHVFPADNPQRVQFIAGAQPWETAALMVLSLSGVEVDESVSRTFYFLHAWQQSVSAVEDEELLEAALGSTETSTRIRRMRRVEMLGGLGPTSCEAAWAELLRRLTADNAEFDKDSGELKSKGRLQLFFQNQNEADDCDDCLPDPALRFLGVDNQTLRIMLTSAQTYVWALDNASPLFRVKVTGLEEGDTGDVTVTMLTHPSDETQWPLTDRVIEIVPFGAIVEGDMPISAESPFFKKVAEQIGAFTRVARSFNPNDCTFTLDKNVGLQAIKDLVHEWDSRHPGGRRLIFESNGERFFYMRMWHMAPTASEVELPTTSARRLRGTNIIPVFRPGRRGDFWTAALRPGTADRCVPVALARTPVAPHGPRHFYAPVTLLTSDDAQDKVINAAECRPRIQPLSDNGCITVTVGDGIRSQGDFTTIAEALRALPGTGGRIVVRPGLYRENIIIEDDISDVVIEGCGENTIIETPEPIPSPVATSPVETNQDTAVIEVRTERVTISSLRINAIGQHAVFLAGTSQDFSMQGVSIVAGIRFNRAFKPGALSVTRPMIAMAEFSEVELRSVVIEPHGRPALEIDGCQRVTLEDVTVAGPKTGPVRLTEALVTIRGSYLVTFRNSIISAFGQVGVHVVGDDNHDIELSELSIISGGHAGPGGTFQSRSAVDIDGGDRIRLGNSAITMDQAFSEHASVVVYGKNVQIVNNQLEVLARCFTPPTSPVRAATFTAARSPVRTARAALTSPIRSSPVRAVAAAVSPPNNCPTLLVQAWGGIHVRGNSLGIEIRGNRILGGVGHGITLGSLLYRQRVSDPVTDRRDRQGAGRGQVAARVDRHLAPTGWMNGIVVLPDGRTVVARDEGPLTDINIVDNRIEGMNGNGISVLSVFGMPGNEDLIEVRGLRIERNTINNNLVRPYDRINLRGEVLPFSTSTLGTGAPIPRLPHAGIALGVAIGADIRDNFIVGNGTSNTLPINGIFILCGDSIRIANNRITGNGGRALLAGGGRAGPQTGIRAGIAVMLAGTDQRGTAFRLRQMLRSPVVDPPAVTNDSLALAVLNNTVRQPEGRALHVVATGPVAVDSNFLASDGNHGSDTVVDNSSIGDIVYIQNLGAPWEQVLPGQTGHPDEREHETDEFDEGTHTAPGTPQYIGFNLGDNLEPVEDFAPVLPRSPWFFVGQGGQVQFTNNQVTFDWQVLRLPTTGAVRPLALFPVAILSLDHVTIDSNQFSLRLRSAASNQVRGTQAPGAQFGAFEPILSHVFAFGATVQVGGNRCSEGVGDATLSLLIAGNLMTQVAFNQTTSEVIATRFDDAQPNPAPDTGPHSDVKDENLRVIRRGNQVMFMADYWGTRFGVDADRIVFFSQQFLKLVFRQTA